MILNYILLPIIQSTTTIINSVLKKIYVNRFTKLSFHCFRYLLVFQSKLLQNRIEIYDTMKNDSPILSLLVDCYDPVAWKSVSKDHFFVLIRNNLKIPQFYYLSFNMRNLTKRTFVRIEPFKFLNQSLIRPNSFFCNSKVFPLDENNIRWFFIFNEFQCDFIDSQLDQY